MNYPCDSCLVGWCSISNIETKSCQDTCTEWKRYWNEYSKEFEKELSKHHKQLIKECSKVLVIRNEDERIY